jgi:hypothetical protein
VDLPAGGSATSTAPCTVAGAEATCTNTVTASVPTGVTERHSSDNTATDVDTILFPATAVSGNGFDDGTTDWWSVTVP